MKFKILSRPKLSAVIVIGIIFTIILFLYFVLQNFKLFEINQVESSSSSVAANNLTFINQQKVSSSLPVNLKIPAINVDSTIEYVGLTQDGAVDVPKGPANVAWFDLGTIPGENGSSIISGHSGWKNNIPAVFDNLYKLKKGDKIYTEDNTGIVTTFIVRELKTYGPSENAPDVFFVNDEKAHLNLITCTGFWNTILKSHSKRLVVFTDKEIK